MVSPLNNRHTVFIVSDERNTQAAAQTSLAIRRAIIGHIVRHNSRLSILADIYVLMDKLLILFLAAGGNQDHALTSILASYPIRFIWICGKIHPDPISAM